MKTTCSSPGCVLLPLPSALPAAAAAPSMPAWRRWLPRLAPSCPPTLCLPRTTRLARFPCAQYKTQFAVRATGKLRVTAADARRSVQLLLTATGSARLSVNGTTLSITGAGFVQTLRTCAAGAASLEACTTMQRTAFHAGLHAGAGAGVPRHTLCRGYCSQLPCTATTCAGGTTTQPQAQPSCCLHSSRTPPSAGATAAQVKTASLQLASGDHDVVLEWMHGLGTAKQQLRFLWRTGAVLTYATPRMLASG